MPAIDLGSVRLTIALPGCFSQTFGDGWGKKLNSEGYIIEDNVVDTNGDPVASQNRASGLFVSIYPSIYGSVGLAPSSGTGHAFGVSGLSDEFNTFVNEYSDFFNYYIVEVADAGAALKTTGGTAKKFPIGAVGGEYDNFKSGQGPLIDVDQAKLDWVGVDDTRQPNTLVYVPGGQSVKQLFIKDGLFAPYIRVAQPVERVGPDGEKEWFTWTAFRVRPKLNGTDTSVTPNVKYEDIIGESPAQCWGWYMHILTEGQYNSWDATTNTPTVSQAPAQGSDEAAATGEELVDTFVDMNKLLTNLPMTKYARRNNDGSRGPKWRDGLLHTWENTPATEGLKSGIPYGFRFHWNPAGWSQSASMTESINPEQFAASNPQQVPLLGGFSNISVTIQLNRMFDLQGNSNERNNGNLNPVDELRISRRASELLELGEYNYPGSGIGVPTGFDRYTGTQDKYADVKNLLRQGTLYDLDYLFAVTNGTTYGSYHVNYTPKTGGNDLLNPSYKMTDSSSSRAENGIPSRSFAGGSPDYGFISAKPVRIWLGPHITFVGRIQSYSIQHLMFTEYMIPTVTQVALNITRSVTMGSTFDESVKLANDQTATSNADTTSTGDPNATDPGA
jgi:hypothetical protein